MNTDERIAKRIQELLKHRAEVMTELIRTNAALGELQAILSTEEPTADEPILTTAPPRAD